MLTQEKLKSLLHYDPETGVFTRAVASGTAAVGDVAGTHHNGGYWQVCVAGKPRLAHRLAWLYVHGEAPAEIDHINGNRLDNRLSNLRAATRSGNGKNLRRPKSNNKSGYLGVSWSEQKRRWVAQLTLNRRHVHIGFFDDPAAAGAAYINAKRSMHAEWCTI